MTTQTQSELVVTGVDFRDVIITCVDGDRRVSWDDLRAAASQASNPTARDHRGFPDAPNGEHALSFVYQHLLDQAQRLAAGGKLRVRVITRTGGATYVSDVRDAAGQYSRIGQLCDEGMDHPQRWMAEEEANKISARLKKMRRLES